MRGTILIVGRDDDLQWAMRDALELEGYEVHHAPGVDAAMRAMRGVLRPDALLAGPRKVKGR